MKKHILIVDDELTIRELCKELLEEEGYEVTLAVDGQDALDKMDYDIFDLFLVDMAMPRIGGFELMKMIKRKQPLAVIVILTGFSSIEGAVKAVHMKLVMMSLLVTKNPDPSLLLKVVKFLYGLIIQLLIICKSGILLVKRALSSLDLHLLHYVQKQK